VTYILRRRPSPALVIACIALFVSLSGVSYGVATGFIDSREIRNNTITSGDVRNNTLRTFDIRNNEVRGFDVRNSSLQGRDIAFNTLTGADVNETTLGKVPSAAAADNASAVTVLKTITPVTVAEGATPATLLTHGPLTVTAACEPIATSTQGVLRVQTSEANSGAVGSSTTPEASVVNRPVLGPGDGAAPVVDVDDLAGGNRTIANADLLGSAPSGKAFSAQFGVYADADGAASCQFFGQVVIIG
jgi:hypothetical protein